MATRLELMKKLTIGFSILVPLVSSCADRVAPEPPRIRRVVMVHGFLETGKTFDVLRKRLEKRGVECYIPPLKHSDGRGGLPNLAEHLKKDIDAKFGPDDPIGIVAFSMGGLVSRHYLQNLGGASRCETLITVSSPHQGTNAAWCYPTEGVRQMRPGSQFLAELRETEGMLGKMPVASYRTPMDLVILPASNSIWERADNLEYPVIMHPLMLSSRPVLEDIERRLLDPLPETKNPARR